VREVDGIAHDVRLFRQRGGDVDGGIGDDERTRVRRRLHHEAMAHAAPAAKRAGHDGAHQLVGVQASLHQRLDLAFDRQLHAARGGGVAVRDVLDPQRAERQARLLRDRLDARAGTDQHGLDQSSRVSVEGGGQAHFVARVDDRHLDAAERTHVLEQPDEIVPLGNRDAHLRQRAARALDPFAGRRHRRLARDHGSSILVRAGAIEHDAAVGCIARGHGDRNAQRVADSNGLVELQRLRAIDRAGAGKPGAQDGGDQRCAPHAVGDHGVQVGRLGEFPVDVLRVHVARHGGEQVDVGRGERALDARAIADGDLVEGAVANDLEVIGGKDVRHVRCPVIDSHARMWTPPSTWWISPVIACAASLTRNAQSEPTSSIATSRGSGAR
jgi:hypothetical protein